MHTEKLKLYTLRGPGVFYLDQDTLFNSKLGNKRAASSKFQAMTVCEPVVVDVKLIGSHGS
jgi:hypothetical protein